MAYPTDSLSVALANIDRIMRQTKQYADSQAAALASGSNAHNIVGIRFNCLQAKSQLQSLSTTPGLAAYAQNEKNDGNLDIVAEFTAVIAALDAVVAAIETLFPKDANGYLLREQWGAVDTTPRQFTAGNVASIRTLIQALSATIS